MPDWTPEAVTSAEEAAARVAAAFPELAGAPVRLVGAGFDNTAYQIGDWIFRFPRRAVAVPLLRREVEHLPKLADHVDLEIPRPSRLVEEGGTFPFAGYRRLRGVTGCAPLAPAQRARLARPLGAFLRQLHTVTVPVDLGSDPFDRANLVVRTPRLLKQLAEIGGIPSAAAAISALGQTAPWAGPRVWVHGDLYPRHLLLQNERLTGVIDWGDTHAGDPALDLSILYTFLPSAAHAELLGEYGPVDADTLGRARFHAWRYSLTLTGYVGETGDAGMARIVSWIAENLGFEPPKVIAAALSR